MEGGVHTPRPPPTHKWTQREVRSEHAAASRATEAVRTTRVPEWVHGGTAAPNATQLHRNSNGRAYSTAGDRRSPPSRVSSTHCRRMRVPQSRSESQGAYGGEPKCTE